MRRANRIGLLTMCLMAACAGGRPVYQAHVGSDRSVIRYEVTNDGVETLRDVTVEVIPQTLPEWVQMSQIRQALGAIPPGESRTAVLPFRVSRDLRGFTPGDVTLVVRAEGRVVERRGATIAAVRTTPVAGVP